MLSANSIVVDHLDLKAMEEVDTRSYSHHKVPWKV